MLGHAQHLREFEGSLSTLEQALKQLIAELKLPIKADIPIGSIGKLLAAAQLVATDAPFRAAWFDPDQATKIVAIAKNSLAKLESINTIEQSVRERISPDELLTLAREIAEPEELKRSWEFVTAKVPRSHIANLEGFAQYLTHEQERLSRLNTISRVWPLHCAGTAGLHPPWTSCARLSRLCLIC